MFLLSEFMPYRLAILSQAISRLIATEYESRFGLSMNQWRVMAVLAAEPDLSAKDICARTLMDKMTVSRTLRKLTVRKLVKRAASKRDGRLSRIRLTKTGLTIHTEIIPLARAYEQQLFESLNHEERESFFQIIRKLQHRAESLAN